MPSSICSAIVVPVRGSTTRRAVCMLSPCSACSSASIDPSAESPPMSPRPDSEPPMQMLGAAPDLLRRSSPSDETSTAKPSASLMAATIPGTCARPWFHPVGTPGRKAPARHRRTARRTSARPRCRSRPARRGRAPRRGVSSLADHPDRMVGDPASEARHAIPDVHLIDAALGAPVDEALGADRAQWGRDTLGARNRRSQAGM